MFKNKAIAMVGNRVLFVANRQGNLYILQDKYRHNSARALSSNNNNKSSKLEVETKKLEQLLVQKKTCMDELKLMHERYGHVSYSKLMNIIAHNSVDDVASALKGVLVRECVKELLLIS
jgi:hypothetical protein